MRDLDISLPEPRRRPKRPRRNFIKRFPNRTGVLFAGGTLGLLLLVSLFRYTVSFWWIGILTGLVALAWLAINLYAGRIEEDPDGNSPLSISVITTILMFLLGWGSMALITMLKRSMYLSSTGLKAKEAELASSGRRIARLSPFIRGQAALLERDEDERQFTFQKMHFEMPGDLMADSAEEVETVILVSWRKFVVGEYRSQFGGTSTIGKAYRWAATVTLIDYRAQTAYHTTYFNGTEPPRRTKGGGNRSGSKPYGRIVKWIEKLPRQAPGRVGPPPKKPWTEPKTPPELKSIPGLIAGWTFDEGQGAVAVDVSGNGANAAIENGSWIDGIRGKALELDGQTSLVNLDDSPRLDFAQGAAFTITGWVKCDDANGTIVSFRRERDEGSVIDVLITSGRLHAQVRIDGNRFRPGEINSGEAINDGKWHHFALTRNGQGGIQLHLDGAPLAQNPVSVVGPISSDLRFVGHERKWQRTGFGGVGQRWLRGTVDEVGIFQRELNKNEIQRLAGREAP